ncbi:MAG: tRNA lysidine(34) synthetase TilS [Acutalibacteraceae bacterium]
MTCKIKETIEKYNMLSSVKSVAVGVSGGADSVCLLHYLSTIRQEYGIILKAVHVNHNIRGEQAQRDCDYVKKLCEELDVDLLVYSVDVPSLSREKGIGVEECGRLVRYEFFQKAGCDAVAVAHTLSDSIETMLFNFARGTALKGVCGIPPKRDNIIRPLINCSRDEIERYCEENDLAYVTDSTNLLDEYARNKIRHHAVPALKQINPELEQCAMRFFESVSMASDYIEQSAEELIEKSRLNENSYRLSDWQHCHEAVRRQAINLLIAPFLTKPVELRHIELCSRAIVGSNGKIELSKDLYLCVKDDIITVQTCADVCAEWRLTVDSEIVNSPYASYCVRLCDISELDEKDERFAVDADSVKGQMILRSRLPGDRIKDKRRSNTKTLKKLFCEKKIPVLERNKIAVLSDDNGVLWVENICANADHAVTQKTKKVYIVKKRG